MKSYWQFIVFTAIVLINVNTVAERRPLAKPGLNISLGNTAGDYEILNTQSGGHEKIDSHATISFDEVNRSYRFRYKHANAEAWDITVWPLRSNVDVLLQTEVRSDETLDVFEYVYCPNELETSAHHLQRLTIEVACSVLGSSQTGRAWRGRMLSEDWGKKLWTWSRNFVGLSSNDVAVPGILSLTSKGLPVPTMCWLQGNAPNISTTSEDAAVPYSELPYSVQKAIAEHDGLLIDSAKGITLGPGQTTVEVPAVRRYFDTAIEQGWLEAGAYRDRLRTLLDNAVQAHEARDAGAVLIALKEAQELVEDVYGRRHSPILSEAYALLHFNIAYLLEHYEVDSKVGAGQ